jgi:hypothetical protein
VILSVESRFLRAYAETCGISTHIALADAF